MLLLKNFLVLTLGAFLLAIAGGFVNNYLRDRIAGNMIESIGLLGTRLFFIVGAFVHELGHLLFSIIFRHKIQALKLFPLTREDFFSGSLGYVLTTYNDKSLFQKSGVVFVGVAPMISGFVVVYASMYLLMPQLHSQIFQLNLFGEGFLLTPGSLGGGSLAVSDFFNLNFLLFLSIVFVVVPNMALSPSDVAVMLKGSFYFFGLATITYFIFWLFGAQHILFLFLQSLIALQLIAILITFLVFLGSYLLNHLCLRIGT